MDRQQNIRLLKDVGAGRIDIRTLPGPNKMLCLKPEGESNFISADGKMYSFEEVEELANNPGLLVFLSCEKLTDDQLQRFVEQEQRYSDD